jgi:hypothetical protein
VKSCSRSRPPGRHGGAAAFTLLALSLSTGCLGSDELGEAAIECPSEDAFPVVSQVLERRCGTVDCHGDGSRPFRIYGRSGLRRPETPESYLEAYPGGDFTQYFTGGTEPTSTREIAANRLSACGVEPEQMMAVVQGDAEPESLTLVRKPRLTESHKGGKLWEEGSTLGDKCLLSWIAGTVDAAACAGELKRP